MSTEERTSCESYEILISTWMDADLERQEQREMLDHLVRCPGCREFYADSRALGGLVALTGAGRPGESPAPEIWRRIERVATRPTAPAQGWPGWAWRAAAVLLLGVALIFVARPTSTPRSGPPRQLDIVLEEDRGAMTETRFLELAAEILRADRRYHFAMQEVMERVVDEEWEPEGASAEGLTEDRTRDDDGGDATRVRV